MFGDGAEHRSLEPLVLEVTYHPDGTINLEQVRVFRPSDFPFGSEGHLVLRSDSTMQDSALMQPCSELEGA